MIKPGDKILLKNVPPKEHDRYPVIVHGMVKYLGKSVTVASIDGLDKEIPEDTIFSIEEDDGEYHQKNIRCGLPSLTIWSHF